MRGRTTGILIVSFTLLSTFLLLGALTSASGALKIETTTTASSSATGLHELTFIQAECPCYPPNGYFYLPWSITLSNGAIGNLTEVNPPNATIVPLWAQCHCSSSSDPYPNISTNQSVSTITFLVPYGSYHYEEYTDLGMVFGQVDFSASNPLPVGINPVVAYDGAR